MPLRRAPLRLRRRAEVHQRLQDQGPQPRADRHRSAASTATPPQDMYFKGALFLNTLRSVVNDDARWWKLLHDFFQHFKYQNILTEDIVAFFNAQLGQDLTPIFDQYLRRTDLPVLELAFNEAEGTVAYRWKADERDFAMPIRVGEPASGRRSSRRPTGSRCHGRRQGRVRGRDRSVLRERHDSRRAGTPGEIEIWIDAAAGSISLDCLAAASAVLPPARQRSITAECFQSQLTFPSSLDCRDRAMRATVVSHLLNRSSHRGWSALRGGIKCAVNCSFLCARSPWPFRHSRRRCSKAASMSPSPMRKARPYRAWPSTSPDCSRHRKRPTPTAKPIS